LRKPITGIAGCCARAARDQANGRAAGKRYELAALYSHHDPSPTGNDFPQTYLLQIGHPGAA